MSVYLVCMVRVDDPETYKKYTAHSPDVINKYGGRFIVRGGPVEAIEGPAYNDRLVIVEFPSKEVVEEFYKSEDYQKIIGYRHESSESVFLLAEGIDPGVIAPDAQVVKSGK